MSKTILAEGINMIVETEGEELLITMGGDFDPHDKVVVIQYLVENLSKLSRIPYNEIMDDLKIVEENFDTVSVKEEEPITEAKQVKKKKKKKERK